MSSFLNFFKSSANSEESKKSEETEGNKSEDRSLSNEKPKEDEDGIDTCFQEPGQEVVEKKFTKEDAKELKAELENAKRVREELDRQREENSFSTSSRCNIS